FGFYILSGQTFIQPADRCGDSSGSFVYASSNGNPSDYSRKAGSGRDAGNVLFVDRVRAFFTRSRGPALAAPSVSRVLGNWFDYQRPSNAVLGCFADRTARDRAPE